MTSSPTSSPAQKRLKVDTEWTGAKLPCQFISTWNNYTEADIESFRAWCEANTQFSVVGREIAPSTGTPHLQGFHQTSGKRSFKAFKKDFRPVRVTPVGKDNGCVPYCEKDEQVCIRTGQYVKKEPGRRTDLDAVAALCAEGKSLREIAEISPTAAIQYSTGISRLIALHSKPRDRHIPKRCICLWGPTGTGKTLRCWEHIEALSEEPYVWSNGMPQYFEGYEGHKHVIMDEYRAQLPMCQLLTLMQTYPTRVNVKFGSAQFVADFMYFTSCSHPRDWYPNAASDPIDQLLRRFESIVHVTSQKQVCSLFD